MEPNKSNQFVSYITLILTIVVLIVLIRHARVDVTVTESLAVNDRHFSSYRVVDKDVDMSECSAPVAMVMTPNFKSRVEGGYILAAKTLAPGSGSQSALPAGGNYSEVLSIVNEAKGLVPNVEKLAMGASMEQMVAVNNLVTAVENLDTVASDLTGQSDTTQSIMVVVDTSCSLTRTDLPVVEAFIDATQELGAAGGQMAQLGSRLHELTSSEATEVMILQKFLKSQPEANWPAGVVANGYYDSVTEQSVRAFQKANGLEETGVVGAKEHELIYRILCNCDPE